VALGLSAGCSEVHDAASGEHPFYLIVTSSTTLIEMRLVTTASRGESHCRVCYTGLGVSAICGQS
jgi:hypothetical protein